MSREQSNSPPPESILAFKFDADGKPRVYQEYKSESDRLALLFIAQNLIAELGKESIKDALRTSAKSKVELIA
jgi:hypothetical protein